MGSSDSVNKKTKPVSKRCIAGFLLSCLGAAAFYVLATYSSYFSPELRMSCLYLIPVELLAAIALSISGTVYASRYHYRFRVLGILGTIISAIALLIALGILLFSVFHERPPQPPEELILMISGFCR